MEEVAHASELAQATREATAIVLGRLRALEPKEFDEPSRLPGWSRLTIACHLRYGSHALLRMTRDGLADRETSYYPDGRASQRPATLSPAPGETAQAVLDDWGQAAAQLDLEWSRLSAAQWQKEVVEPAGNPDLGTVPLARLALSCLTEVEVHGTDLGLDAPAWSPTLVGVGLPTRLRWLSTRRTNHRPLDDAVRGSWILHAVDGPMWRVTVDRGHVDSGPASDGDTATAVIEGTSRDLLALLLGRPPLEPLRMSGDVAFGEQFQRAFPGP